MPPKVASLLYVKGSGPYPSRSELLFGFITTAMRAGVNSEVITDACLNDAHAGCGIFEHCRENGGRRYVIGQVKHTKENRSSHR